MSMSVPISFEFFPPNTPVGDEKLKTVVAELGVVKPEFFSVTYGAGGSTRDKTLATVSAIAALGHEAAPHLSCVGSTRAGIARDPRAPTARRTSAAWSRCAATCRAAPPRPASSAMRRELVRFIRETQGARLAHRGRAPTPRCHPQQRYAKRDLQHFADKVEAGAELGDHAVLLQRRRLLPLRRRGAQARRHGADRAGHHADPQLRARSPSSRSATASRSRAGWRSRWKASWTTRRRSAPSASTWSPTCAAPDRRRRAGHPLLHAEPVAAVARDLQAAGARTPSTRAARPRLRRAATPPAPARRAAPATPDRSARNRPWRSRCASPNGATNWRWRSSVSSSGRRPSATPCPANAAATTSLYDENVSFERGSRSGTPCACSHEFHSTGAPSRAWSPSAAACVAQVVGRLQRCDFERRSTAHTPAASIR